MNKKRLFTGLVLCAGVPVIAQVNDVPIQSDATAMKPVVPARMHVGSPMDALGDPVAGPYVVDGGNAANLGQLGVDHAFGHYWVSSRGNFTGGRVGHWVGKFQEDGTFVKDFDQAPESASSSWGYRDGASDEGANQLFFGWESGSFVVIDYDPATGDITTNCVAALCVPGTIRAIARTPAGTFITKSFGSDINEFDLNGNVLNTWPDPFISAYGCAYDASTDTYWWTDAGAFVVETDATMIPTGVEFDAFLGFTAFVAQGGLDIYADARSATGSAFVMLGQGNPDEISVFEARAGASNFPSTGTQICNTGQPPPPPPPLTDCSLETLFASNNGGAVGGIVFMDMVVGPEDLTIEGLEMNTSLGSPSCLEPFQVEMYTRPATYIGGECLAAEWTRVATGDGLARGNNNTSQVVFPTPPVLSANASMGVALVMLGADHDYTNGTGANQAFSNADMALRLGAAQNAPWNCSTFTPRVWNGRFYYTPASGCTVCAPCACDWDGDPVCTLFDFLAFQTAFVAADPCACDLDGNPACTLFDFLEFQNQFVSGCP